MDKAPRDGIQQRPRSGATRCPYCHDDCEAGQEACACAECLSRHHLKCWDEAGACSSCRATSRLITAVTPEAKSRARYAEVVEAWGRLWLVYNVALALVTLATLRSGLFSYYGLTRVGGGALFANFLFMAGPGFELFLQMIGARETRALRWVLFGLGFLCAIFLTFGACGTLLENL